MSWKECFDSRENSSSINKENMEHQLCFAFDSSLLANDCKAAVERHEETVFMVKISLNSGLNFKEVGGGSLLQGEEGVRFRQPLKKLFLNCCIENDS